MIFRKIFKNQRAISILFLIILLVFPGVALAVDTDSDGLEDDNETNIHFTDPNDSDSDDDGLSDGDEVNTYFTDPLTNADLDGDSLTDADEILTYFTNHNDSDSDDDGRNDYDEINVAPTTNPNDSDSDDDGLNDNAEVNTYFTDPNQGSADLDSDGLTDAAEILTHLTNHNDSDSDDDSLSDGYEITSSFTNPNDYCSPGPGTIDFDSDGVYSCVDPNDSSTDTDSDNLTDGYEYFTSLTLLNDSDTDDDGRSDYEELNVVPYTNPLDSDSDNDDLSDGYEVGTSLTDPNDSDSDDDGVNDGYEVNTSLTNPNDSDSDDDLLSDGAEINTYNTNPNNISGDLDGDGLTDAYEILTSLTNHNDTDSDDDDLSDSYEINISSTNPLDSDSDDDGLSDGYEVSNSLTYPNDSDSDEDNLSDGYEVNTSLTNPNDSDSDNDGLSDGYEVNTSSTDPNDTDTDDGGVDDGTEVNIDMTDPNNFGDDNVADVTDPTISTLSPLDNATDVSTTANLVITFDEDVNKETGNILIKQTSDNSTVETIDVTTAQVSGDGTDTITINPSVTLDESTEYYIQIDATAFDDLAGNSFAGISNTTSWSFTTADETAPTITSVSSDKTNGAYTIGEVIDIDVTFSEAVTSQGNVAITLETGDTDRSCTFTVSNSTTGTCNYTVQAGDTSSDLTVSSISGTIEDQSGNDVVNFVPATNLAANKALVIDTTVPTVSITAPTEGATVSGASVSITASASDTNLVGVQFKRDTNTNIGAEDTTSTYSVTWDTTALSDGAQSLIAVARDTAGNYATSTAVSVTVDNVVDSSPSGSGGGRSSSITSSCTPSDRTITVGDKVSFDIDIDTTEDSYTFKWIKVLSGTDEEETYTFTEEGKFYPRAEAKDSAGNKTTVNCGTITVESDNDTDDSEDTEEQDNNDYLYKLIKQFESDLRLLMKLGIELPNKIIEILNDLLNNNSSTFTRDLELGMEGEDVKQLQIFLNNNGYTVSTQGPGSPNNETTRFGYATQSALINFQKANNITPALGYFGPVTRNIINNLSN